VEAPHHHVQSVLSCGVPVDHVETVMKPLLWYLYSNTAFQETYAFNKNSKIIVMLRNPVDMVYSLLSQIVYSFTEERKDFETAWHEPNLPIQRPVPAFQTFSQIGKYAYYVGKLFRFFLISRLKIALHYNEKYTEL
jgi:hypothetical protein